MQSVELYNPNASNLHLTPFNSTYSICEDVNPLNYQLTTDDFITLAQADGQLSYALDPSTTTSLFWVLHRLARYITRAASHGLHYDPTIPFAPKGYIPQIYFDRINMRRPDILTIQDQVFLNPLCGYTTRENLTAWYRDFQTIGRLTVQWIQTAQRQTLQVGPGTGWNWENHHGNPRLEYPERRLITSENLERDDEDRVSDTTSEGSSDGSEIGNNGNIVMGNPGDKGKRVVLHPVESAYATRYPGFDAFDGQPLTNNGYVDDNSNRCRAMIVHPDARFNPNLTPMDYSNTLFTAYNTVRRADNDCMDE